MTLSGSLMLVGSSLRSSLFPSLKSIHLTCSPSVPTTSQPKSLAAGEDNSVFAAEIGPGCEGESEDNLFWVFV